MLRSLAVLFNLGLCAESRGELYEASDYYRRVISGGEDAAYARQGMARGLRERRPARTRPVRRSPGGRAHRGMVGSWSSGRPRTGNRSRGTPRRSLKVRRIVPK